mgnify:FL=1|jgi:hypothetical protein
MSELYIYDDDLVEDYNVIDSLTKHISEISREKSKKLKKTKNNENIKETKSNSIKKKPVVKSTESS